MAKEKKNFLLLLLLLELQTCHIKIKWRQRLFESQLSSAAVGVYSTLVAALTPQSACPFMTSANIFSCCCPCLVLFVLPCAKKFLFGSIREKHEKARFGPEFLKICFC